MKKTPVYAPPSPSLVSPHRTAATSPAATRGLPRLEELMLLTLRPLSLPQRPPQGLMVAPLLPGSPPHTSDSYPPQGLHENICSLKEFILGVHPCFGIQMENSDSLIGLPPLGLTKELF